jgi:hypothetical protein
MYFHDKLVSSTENTSMKYEINPFCLIHVTTPWSRFLEKQVVSLHSTAQEIPRFIYPTQSFITVLTPVRIIY